MLDHPGVAVFGLEKNIESLFRFFRKYVLNRDQLEKVDWGGLDPMFFHNQQV